jgi:mono/diheme cytochrome c family protein
MKKGVKSAIAVGALLASCVAGASWYIMVHGFSARERPTVFEAFIARHLRHLSVPRSELGALNPFPAETPEILVEALAHFADHCATCHANDGSGRTNIGQRLYPKAPDMRQSATQSMSDGELFYIIHNGVRFTGMPAWGDDPPRKDVDSWKLVHFIRHLPNITAEEAEHMKELNPKSPADLAEEEEIRKFLQGDDSQPAEGDHKHN